MTDDSNDPIERALRTAHEKAVAEEYIKREALFATVSDAYQDPAEAVNNIAYAMGRFGLTRALEIMETQPDRIGTPRGAWYTRDGWTSGGFGRAAVAGEALGRLPGIARELVACEERSRATRNAVDRYRSERGPVSSRGPGEAPPSATPPADPRGARTRGAEPVSPEGSREDPALAWLREPPPASRPSEAREPDALAWLREGEGEPPRTPGEPDRDRDR